MSYVVYFWKRVKIMVAKFSFTVKFIRLVEVEDGKRIFENGKLERGLG